MPWPHNVSVWQPAAQGQRQDLDIAAQLKNTTQNCLDWSVHLGKSADAQVGPVRMIAFRLSDESAGRRRAQLREKYRTKGKQPTVKAMELAGWLILLTNAPIKRLPTLSVSYLYRVRWQIELIFKQWKSVLRLDVLASDNPYRVQCELWARLLAALLFFLWHQHANAACLREHQREISFSKLAKLLQQQAQSLASAWVQDPLTLRCLLRGLWHKIMKLARKQRQLSRPTTLENLHTHWLDLKPVCV